MKSNNNKSPHGISSAEALNLLREGNLRFANGLRSIEHIFGTTRLKELAEKGQSPFAIILTCSDSRVPAEIIFDRGFGDLFVIRVAGNVVSPSVIGSIEFAASSFGTSLCVVMGHSQCGAVKAALQSEIENAQDAHSHIGKLVKKVRPAVRSVACALPGPLSQANFEEVLHLSTIENLRRSAELTTRKSPILHKLVERGKLQVVGALYDLHTGRVEFDLSPPVRKVIPSVPVRSSSGPALDMLRKA